MTSPDGCANCIRLRPRLTLNTRTALSKRYRTHLIAHAAGDRCILSSQAMLHRHDDSNTLLGPPFENTRERQTNGNVHCARPLHFQGPNRHQLSATCRPNLFPYPLRCSFARPTRVAVTFKATLGDEYCNLRSTYALLLTDQWRWCAVGMLEKTQLWRLKAIRVRCKARSGARSAGSNRLITKLLNDASSAITNG